MLFNSIHFLVFFPVVTLLYFAIAARFRWILLLLASYYFYMCWKIDYSVLLLASTLITYWTALKMGKAITQNGKLCYLILCLVLNLSILFTFKYFNFVNDSIRMFTSSVNISYDVPELRLLLPVGISFYTFQALSYSIDVYRGEKAPERHLGIFALYVSFFPQLVAGPIERSTRLLPQLYRKYDFDYARVTDGLRLMAWGFFKKLVIADRLAVMVDRVYDSPQEYTGVLLLVSTVCFSYQIYCDFSGYSDIAIGAARIMGFDLMTNFKTPYFSKSIPEFWRRWHISLSTWFRDYVYIPLGGSRMGKWRLFRNIAIVFLVCGLWHGANWTFLLWGALHAVYMLFGLWTRSRRAAIVHYLRIEKVPFLHDLLKVLATFILVTFAWILFRAQSLGDAYYIITHLFSGTGYFLANITDVGYVRSVFGQLGVAQSEIVIAFLSIMVLEFVQLIQKVPNLQSRFFAQPVYVRWATYYLLSAIIIFLGAFNSAQEFIYFQF